MERTQLDLLLLAICLKQTPNKAEVAPCTGKAACFLNDQMLPFFLADLNLLRYFHHYQNLKSIGLIRSPQECVRHHEIAFNAKI